MEIYQKRYIDAEEIPLALEEAFARFNDDFLTDYSFDNVKVAFFNFETFPTVYREFCENDFPSWLEEDYTNPRFCSDAQAMALVEEANAGILINISCPFSYFQWVKALLHELSHIYAVQSEYGGRNFYRECCSNTELSAEEDMLYVGYTVWKEFIADFLTAIVVPESPVTLYRYRGEIKRFDSVITGLKPNCLKAMSLVLVAVFTSKEHFETESKEKFLEILKSKNVLDMEEYRELIQLVLDHIRNEAFSPQMITDDFIDEFGSLIRKIVIGREIRRLKSSTIF